MSATNCCLVKDGKTVPESVPMWVGHMEASPETPQMHGKRWVSCLNRKGMRASIQYTERCSFRLRKNRSTENSDLDPGILW